MSNYESYSTKDVEKVIESYHCFLAKGINEDNIFMAVGSHILDQDRIFVSLIRPTKSNIIYPN